jgi:hypothetical protein
MSRFVARTSAVGTRQLAGRGTVGERALPPHVQRLLLPGNNGYFALRGKKTFLPPATYSQNRNLMETFCTCDTQNPFIKETKFPDAQCKGSLLRFLHIAYISSFAGHSVGFREKEMEEESNRCKTYLLSLCRTCELCINISHLFLHAYWTKRIFWAI